MTNIDFRRLQNAHSRRCAYVTLGMISFLLMIASYAYSAFILSAIWDWLLLDATKVDINIGAAIGLVLIADMLKFTVPGKQENDERHSQMTENGPQGFCATIIVSAITRGLMFTLVLLVAAIFNFVF